MKYVFTLLCVLVLLGLASFSFAAYGGGATYVGPTASPSSLSKDVCPDGDLSGSYYDGTCSEDGEEIIEEEVIEDILAEIEEIITTVTVVGWIFDDLDANGSRDDNEPGIQGAVVTLKTADGEVVGTDMTDVHGKYEIFEVMPGDYKVHVLIPDSEELSWKDALLALFVPRVHAATEYEFSITVGEEDAGSTVVSTVPVSNGSVSGSAVVTTVEEPMVEEEEIVEEVVEETTTSIRDIIKGRSDNSDTESDVVDTSSGDGFVLPTILAPTGASI